jgi:hypothetical protein
MACSGIVNKGIELGYQISRGSNHVISGAVTKRAGNQWWGIFRAPVGMEICRAILDVGNMSITGGATLNSRIVREPRDNGLGFYAVIPQNESSGQWIDATMFVSYVPGGTTGQNNCKPTNEAVWRCKGQNCATSDGSRM